MLRVLTAWNRVLLEKLAGSKLVKTFPTFYGNQRFITAFTRARHCPYPKSDQFNASIPRLEDPFLILLLTYLLHGAESFLRS
jgi:hypothetical protein